jgi:septal ring factor EnvC (AmiA/AmiB activator)
MPDQSVPAAPLSQSQGDVERIRTILFGQQMRDYEQRFVAFQRDLTRFQGELERLGEELTAKDAEQSKKLQALRGEMQRADNEARDELRQTAQKLSDEKVDRALLGDLFIELGNHLKDGGALPHLLTGIE